MFIGLYCCLLVRVQSLSLAWAGLHDTESLWTLFQGSIVEFRLGYPIFYLGTSKFSPSTFWRLHWGANHSESLSCPLGCIIANEKQANMMYIHMCVYIYIYKYTYIYIYIYICIYKWKLYFLSFKKETKWFLQKKKKKNTIAMARGVLCHEKYNI